MHQSKLILETGEVFEGISPKWVKDQNFGEVVFNTGMVGYTEVLTDPSYKGQIVVFTYPMIGNYGVEPECHWESDQIHASGLVVSELAPFYARNKSEMSLEEWCKKSNTPLIANVDTRALTKVLRKHGVVAGAIIVGDKLPKKFVDVNEKNLVADVSVNRVSNHGEGEKTVIVVDCGMKANIWRHLCAYSGITLKRVPYDYDYTNEAYDGIFLSNGPGDPKQCQKTTEILQKAMKKTPNVPIFGICLGAQILGLAIGAKTYKLKFGHRAQNHPCLHEGTNRCYLTSQNHGFGIDEETLPNGWRVSFRNLNDQSVQGIEHEKSPYFAVQFHPEAAPGPVDTAWLFDQFIDTVNAYEIKRNNKKMANAGIKEQLSSEHKAS
ncbi:glutamine-hydrolyzing carbamoyl-phosphate synthase small subunit [Thiotrichales bacterium 19S11-10]|nr:glutamine-hydrolyzing carbamoyl-phosphate synthase small subunit [Thiotrichales bacterium 19S11-10]